MAHTPAALHAIVADAFNCGDVDALMDVYEQDAVVVVPPAGRYGRLGGFLNELAGLAQPDLNLVRTAGHAALDRPIGPVPDAPDRVHFQYFTPAPPFPCTFVAARGGGDVRALPGVTHLHWPVPRGTRLDGGVGWRALAMVCGDAPDHTAMLELVDRAQALLTFRLAGDGGAVELTGRQLHRCRPVDSDGYRVQQF